MQEVKKLPNNNLSMIFLLCATVCFFANNHILAVSIPLLINDMGFGLDIIGYATAGMGLITILMKFITPSIIKSIKFKLLIILDLTLISIITLCFVFFKSYPIAIIILRTLFGAPFSLFPIINLIVVTNIALNKEEIVKGVSLIGMAMPISMMLSPSLTEILLDNFSYQIVFYTALISSILCLLFYMLGLSKATNYENKKNDSKSFSLTFNSFSSIFNIKEIIIPIIAFFFLGMVDMLIITYLPLIATSSNETYSFYFIIFSISMVLSQRFYSFFKTSNKYKLIIGYFLLGGSTILIGFSNNYFYIFAVISAICFGIGFSLTETTTNTLMILKKETATIYVTLQQLSIGIGRTAGPYLIALFSKDIEKLKLCFIFIGICQIIPIFMICFIKVKNKGLIKEK